jgi:hypothetical protein
MRVDLLTVKYGRVHMADVLGRGLVAFGLGSIKGVYFLLAIPSLQMHRIVTLNL